MMRTYSTGIRAPTDSHLLPPPILVMVLTFLLSKAYTADVTVSSEFSSTAGFRNVSSAPVTVYNKVGRLPWIRVV